MIRLTRSTLTALLLAAAALVLAPSVRAQQSGSTMGQSSTDHSMGATGESMTGATTPGQLPQGITPKDLGNARGEVRDTFNGVVKAVLTRDNYKDLADYFAKSDRDRLNVSDNKYNDRLNGAIDQFRQAWKSKYNDDFSFKANDALSDQFLNVTTGQVTNPGQVDHWPLSPTGKPLRETAKPTMNQGTEVAIANFTGVEGVNRPIEVSLVREGSDWKIDIPDSISKDQLEEHLAKHITDVVSMQGQWPSDQNAAARVVTAHILYGLYGVEKGQMGTSESPSTSTGMNEKKAHHPESTEPGKTSEEKSSTESDIQD